MEVGVPWEFKEENVSNLAEEITSSYFEVFGIAFVFVFLFFVTAILYECLLCIAGGR